jgi:hypothetical protein
MKPWTTSEKRFVEQNIGTKTIPEIAELLNRTIYSVDGFCQRNNIKTNRRGFFKKGDIPHNKGKKIPEEIKAKYVHTMYKKGNVPQNTKHDGAISIRETKGRPYKWIRVEKAIWKLYHRFLWEQHHGKIPKGYSVRFIDGDSLNCVIENLQIVTFQQNLNMNHNRKKAGEKMKKYWHRFRIRKKYQEVYLNFI